VRRFPAHVGKGQFQSLLCNLVLVCKSYSGTEHDFVKDALEKMKNNPRDRIGILGELGVTGLGVTAGIALSGSIAAAAGGATLAGSTTSASILGGIFVTTTPVGWIVGAALAGGSLAYAASQLVRSGGEFDVRKKITVRELEERIQTMRQEANGSTVHNEKMSKIITSIQYLVSNLYIEQDKATELLAAIEKKSISVDEAFELLEAIAKEKSASGIDDEQQIP
jgi:hypothetical protein